MVDRDIALAKRTVEMIEAGGGQGLAFQADMTRASDCAAVVEAAMDRYGRLDYLDNNVGIGSRGSVVDETEESWHRLMTVNVDTMFLAAKHAIPAMRRTGGGAIVNVSSRAAVLGAPGEYVDYAASKAALDTLTVGLAREVAAEGIRVNAVRAGIIYTDIHASGGEPGRPDRLGPTLPMQRSGTAVEVARAILWLLSDEASYTTGSFVDVSGGR